MTSLVQTRPRNPGSESGTMRLPYPFPPIAELVPNLNQPPATPAESVTVESKR